MDETPERGRSVSFERWYTPATSLDIGHPDAICIKVTPKEEKLPSLPLPSKPLPLTPPMQRKCLVFAVLFWGAVTILLIIGLGLSIKFAYVNNRLHLHQDTCEILSCSSTSLFFTLSLDNRVYQQSIPFPNGCPDQNTTVCYYDDRYLPESLSLSEINASVLGVFLIFFLGGCLIMIIGTTARYYWRFGRMVCS